MNNIISMEEISSDEVTLWQVQFTDEGMSEKQIGTALAFERDHFDQK